MRHIVLFMRSLQKVHEMTLDRRGMPISPHVQLRNLRLNMLFALY